MLVLVIDTAGPVGGVLLARIEAVASDRPSDRPKTEILGEGRLERREFSIQLISAIADLLRAHQLQLSDVNVFAVVSGPGSFTGLRVGLSAVKAMAEVTEKPVIALSRLAIMISAANISDSPARAAEPAHAVLDAGRGEFYHGIYRDGGRTCIGERLETGATLATSFESIPGAVIASEAVVLDEIGTFTDSMIRSIPDVTVREALLLIVSAWQNKSFSDVSLLDANYLRRLDVEDAARTVAEISASGS